MAHLVQLGFANRSENQRLLRKHGQDLEQVIILRLYIFHCYRNLLSPFDPCDICILSHFFSNPYQFSS